MVGIPRLIFFFPGSRVAHAHVVRVVLDDEVPGRDQGAEEAVVLPGDLREIPENTARKSKHN